MATLESMIDKKRTAEELHEAVESDAVACVSKNGHFYLQWGGAPMPMMFTPAMIVTDARLEIGVGDAASSQTGQVDDTSKMRLRLAKLPTVSCFSPDAVHASAQYVADVRRVEDIVNTSVGEPDKFNYATRVDGDASLLLSLAVFGNKAHTVVNRYGLYDYDTCEQLDPAKVTLERGDVVMCSWKPAYVYAKSRNVGVGMVLADIFVVARFASWKGSVDRDFFKQQLPPTGFIKPSTS